MLIPIRCISCNNIISNKWNTFKKHLNSGMTEDNAFEKVNLHRYCCKRMFLGHVDIIDKLLLYPQNINNDSNEISVLK